MSSGWIIFFEISLVLGLCLFFGIQQIREINRLQREREAKKAEAESKTGAEAGARTGDREAS